MPGRSVLERKTRGWARASRSCSSWSCGMTFSPIRQFFLAVGLGDLKAATSSGTYVSAQVRHCESVERTVGPQGGCVGLSIAELSLSSDVRKSPVKRIVCFGNHQKCVLDNC